MPFTYSTKVDGVDNVMASHVNQLQTDLNAQLAAGGTYAARPAAATDGRVYFPSDKPVICRDNGSSWDEYDTSSGAKITIPNDASFTWDNQGGSTVTTTNGVVVFNSPSGSTIRGRYVAASNPMTVTARLGPLTKLGGNTEAGIYVSDATKYVTLGIHTCYGGGAIRCTKWTNSTTFSANYSSRVPDELFGMALNWGRIQDDGTNLNFSVSQDGINWVLFQQTTRLDFLASVARVGWFQINSTGVAADYYLHSWSKV